MKLPLETILLFSKFEPLKQAYMKTRLCLHYPFSRCPETFKHDSWKLDKRSKTHDAYKSAMCELYFHKEIK